MRFSLSQKTIISRVYKHPVPIVATFPCATYVCDTRRASSSFNRSYSRRARTARIKIASRETPLRASSESTHRPKLCPLSHFLTQKRHRGTMSAQRGTCSVSLSLSLSLSQHSSPLPRSSKMLNARRRASEREGETEIGKGEKRVKDKGAIFGYIEEKEMA